MPEGGHAGTNQGILARLTRARLASGAGFAGALVMLSVGVSSVSGAVAGPGVVSPAAAVSDAPAAPTQTPVAASKLSAGERTVLEDVERYLQIASLPTATAVPPTATAVPPTPAAVPPARTPPPARPVAPAPTSTPAPPPQQPGLDTSPMDAYSRALFDATNARRTGAGLPPLRANGQLAGIARIRSHDMADHNYFAHVSPVTGDNAFTIMDRYGVPYGWAGENLAKNNYPDDEAVGVADDALWNSAPHRENILNPNYTDMGIALVIDSAGMKYFTIIFTGPPQ